MQLARRTAMAVFASGLVLVLALSAAALGLDEAKAAGQVGEQIDGYVGLVKGQGTAAARELVARVNAGRRDAYAEIARSTGASVEAVAARAGQRLVGRAPPGQWVLDGTGSWKRR